MGRRRAANQAWRPDAAEQRAERGPAAAARVSRGAEMTRATGPDAPARIADERTRRDLADPPTREERPDHELPPAVDQNVSDLERVWSERPGLYGWLSSVNHKAI